MSKRRPSPRRVPGAPCATSVVIAELLPDTHVYMETHRHLSPILVIDTGPTEIQLSLVGDRHTIEDLLILDGIIEATAQMRIAALPFVD